VCLLDLVENIAVRANPNGPSHKDYDRMMKGTDKDTLKSSSRAKGLVISCHLILSKLSLHCCELFTSLKSLFNEIGTGTGLFCEPFA